MHKAGDEERPTNIMGRSQVRGMHTYLQTQPSRPNRRKFNEQAVLVNAPKKRGVAIIEHQILKI